MKLAWLFAVAAHVYKPILWLLYPTKATAIEEKFQKKAHLVVVVNQVLYFLCLYRSLFIS